MRKSTERAEAILRGDTHYFTGRPCKRGGVGPRNVKDHKCCCELCLKVASDSQKRFYHGTLKKDPNYILRNRERVRVWREKNLEKSLRAREKWAKENPEKLAVILKRADRKYKERHKDDPIFKMKKRIRQMIERIIGGSKKGGGGAEKLVGYKAKELKSHIENLFQDGMTWDNYGTMWQIDHIAPVSELLRLGIKDPKIINSLDNLRPLWKSDNISKGAKFDLGVSIRN